MFAVRQNCFNSVANNLGYKLGKCFNEHCVLFNASSYAILDTLILSLLMTCAFIAALKLAEGHRELLVIPLSNKTY